MSLALRTSSLLRFVTSLVVCVASILALILVQVSPYTNLTAAQADAQEERLLNQQVQACERAGGSPQADFSTMYCNVSFVQPNDSWYVEPQPNPLFAWWQMGQILLILFALGAACLALRGLFSRRFGARPCLALNGRGRKIIQSRDEQSGSSSSPILLAKEG